jgi:tRNA-splicing ligase RtcB
MSESISENLTSRLEPTGPAMAELPVAGADSPIAVVGTPPIRQSFGEETLQQAINCRLAPGVNQVVLNPDAHVGYGAPIGCVMVSPTHIYPGPVGVDIKCSMSLLQLELDAEELRQRPIRRRLIDAICRRIPTGPGRGARHAPEGRELTRAIGYQAATTGASPAVLDALGIPVAWAGHCEDAVHHPPLDCPLTLDARLDQLLEAGALRNFNDQAQQLGSYGGGNHFGECEIVRFADDPRLAEIAQGFGLRAGQVAFLSHCGSRGFGYTLAQGQFRALREQFARKGRPLPAGDRDLVYAELGTEEANRYLCDMCLGANFATVNHLLINQLVLEAFSDVFPGIRGELIYFISHNIARREHLDGQWQWVHRKGATRAFPAGHPELAGGRFAQLGHPILLPGNPAAGSAVMVAAPGAARFAYSINHGAGRQMSRGRARRELDQATIDRELLDLDVLTNCRAYPRDEAPAAYKDFNEVLRSVELADLAHEVARLHAIFVIKDAGPADD